MRVFLLEIKLMLKEMLRNTIALMMAVIVLVSTSGFTVFKHSCSTEQTTEFSLLIPEFNCEHYQEEASLPACCCAIPIPEDEESYNSSKCCDTDTFVVKLNITVQLTDYDKSEYINVAILPVLAAKDLHTEDDKNRHIIVSNNLPPPLAGKALHIYLHQLNIPYPSV